MPLLVSSFALQIAGLLEVALQRGALRGGHLDLQHGELLDVLRLEGRAVAPEERADGLLLAFGL